jgi:hypothetical protein
MSLTKFVMQPTIHVSHSFLVCIFLNTHNRFKCNVGCLTNFVGSLLQVNYPVEVTKSHQVKLKIGD